MLPLEDIALVHGPFATIVADPPWDFRTYSEKGAGRSPSAHYPTMGLDDIKALPVADLAARNACLFLWTTGSHLPMALEVMEAWGFTYKSCAFVWVKTTRTDQQKLATGLGFWTRQNAEHVLLGTRGRPKRKSANVQQTLLAPRLEHSRKPEEIQDRIERLVDGPYLELFARRHRPGWFCWGDELEDTNHAL